jgi:hypothetical protein
VAAEDLSPSEYRVKAAFLYNFAKLVDWPTNTFSSADAPLVIGVLGKSPVSEALAGTIKDKKVGLHPVRIRRFERVEDVSDCQVLFVCDSEKGRMAEILAKLQGKSILTVADADGFADSGGMIQLIKQREAVRFEINTNATARANLRVSSRLLQLAATLKGGAAGRGR